jgi:uncharacterized membrane protein
MLRQHVASPSEFADPPRDGVRVPGAPVRRNATPLALRIAKVVLAPLVAVGAVVAGLGYVILLPVCGIATILEGLAKVAWRFVREAFRLVVPARPRPH